MQYRGKVKKQANFSYMQGHIVIPRLDIMMGKGKTIPVKSLRSDIEETYFGPKLFWIWTNEMDKFCWAIRKFTFIATPYPPPPPRLDIKKKHSL